MKQAFLALMLIAVPVALFTAYQFYLAPARSSGTSLGDLSGLKAIVADVRAIARSGDLAGAEKRITDFETAWDSRETAMRPLNEAAWGKIDDAADAALQALRDAAPKPHEVAATLDDLLAILENPYRSAGDVAGLQVVAGIPVTDASGRPLACETMIQALRSAIAAGAIPDDRKAEAEDFEAKSVERCNADDDAHADAFSAQGLALSGSGQ